MITRTYLPDEIVLPCGAVLKAIIGGHYRGQQVPFLTVENSGIDVTKNGWMDQISDPDPERGERKAIIKEAKMRGLKYRQVAVLSRNLRGKLDLHGRHYQSTKWVFVEVKP